MKYCFVIVAVLWGLLGCEQKSSPEQMFSTAKEETATKPIRQFVLKLLDGDVISLRVHTPQKIEILTPKYQGKVVMLDFWATWCPPCIDEIPHLKSLAKTYEDDLLFVGVLAEADKSLEELETFVKEYDIKYPIATTHINNTNLDLLELLTNLRTLPFKTLYDREGNYVTHYYGAVPEEMLNIKIKATIDANTSN